MYSLGKQSFSNLQKGHTMPRFTLIEVDNLPDTEIDVIALPFYLKEGLYRHQNDIDFASEAEVYEAIAGWPAPPPSMTRMIMEYHNIGWGRWHVKGLVAQQYHFGHFAFNIPYRTSLIVSTNQGGRMYSDMLPIPEMMIRLLEEFGRQHPVVTVQIPRGPEIAPPIVNVNSAQNTHTASVHHSATEAIEKLQTRYQATLDEEKSLVGLTTMLEKLESNDFPDLMPIVIAGAKRSIQSLSRIADEIEGSSGLTVKRIVALVWTAINDKETLLTNKEDALKGFIKYLYELRRDGNLDDHGNDNGKSDKPICLGGTINKLVETLNTIHPDVQIIYATKASASLKFPVLVREYTVNFIKNSAEKTKLFEQIKRDNRTGKYSIPDSVLAAIKEEVEKVFKEEFEVHLKNQDLDGIFSSYEYVSLTENNFNSIKMFIYKECEEKIAVFRTHINNLSEHLKNTDIPEKNKQKIERLNNALTDMLDGLINSVKEKEGINKDDCSMFKTQFSQLLNENELFSSSKFELLHKQILLLLNRLVEILSGTKIMSISSKITFFQKKQEVQSSLTANFGYAIDHLTTACSF